MPPDAPPPQFRAVIVPHRSLSPRALRTLIGVIVAASCLTAALVVALGAWPVVGFTGAEILLVALLLRHHAGGERTSETLSLNDSGLQVVRTDRHGRRREVVLPAPWLSVTLRDRPGRVPALILSAPGLQEEVATMLGEEAKRVLAAELQQALQLRRHPRFDNPQLRG
ncbi:conserved protein of unknown function [Rhodovastum atsumiense]|uniref:DUF2244 domain-containing protein n=1 Tax=Rhodovastum atsumiense TaxID=504468 RepID=A0A5M6IKM8_9PROT|nr:DUF2244 domain-containing protein [Rhodovastum atsumiense]KAA5608810.1 DUF2244 domain-containing protein [Rhodovastum atsumiense]CAH2600852.1 conserved protein of unknown function [Rhodovastum atsumiense]